MGRFCLLGLGRRPRTSTRRMQKLHILVEGQAEEVIVNNVIGPYLSSERPARHHLIDYYGFPHDAPGMADRPVGSPYVRVEHVENALADAVGSGRFLPHLVLHEIEAWVLADCSRLADLLGNSSETARLAQVAAVSGPEMADDGVDTAPSKRVMSIYPKYAKTLDGPLVITDIGLDEIRRQCPHANRWLSAIETVLKPVTEIRPTTEGQESQLPSEFCADPAAPHWPEPKLALLPGRAGPSDLPGVWLDGRSGRGLLSRLRVSGSLRALSRRCWALGDDSAG